MGEAFDAGALVQVKKAGRISVNRRVISRNGQFGGVMSEPQLPENDVKLKGLLNTAFMRREGPYLLLLALTVLGIAMTGVARYPVNLYWELMTPIIALVCIFTAWPDAPDKGAQWRLIWRQVLHWVAFLIAMNLALLPDVQRLIHPRGVSLMILLQLALGTFVAGVHISSWRICFLGVAMAVGVPTIAWVERSAFAIVGLVALIGLFLAFRSSREKSG